MLKIDIVKKLQKVLNKLTDAKLAVDGIYGNITENAVKIALDETNTAYAIPISDKEPYSKNFSLKEYYSNKIVSDKKIRKTVIPPKELWVYIQKSMDMLEKLRKKSGNKPIYITSGYRTPEYNSWLYKNSNGGGVAKNSPHMRGSATDIQIKCMEPKQVYKIADKLFPDAGIGLYDSFVHIDWDIVLPNGNRRPARW